MSPMRSLGSLLRNKSPLMLLLCAGACSSVRVDPGGGGAAPARPDAEPDPCVERVTYDECMTAREQFDCSWFLERIGENGCSHDANDYRDFGCHAADKSCESDLDCGGNETCRVIPTSGACGQSVSNLVCRFGACDPDATFSICLPTNGSANE